MNKFQWSTEYLYECNQQQYLPKIELEHSSSLMTSVSPFYSTSPSASPDLIYNNETLLFPGSDNPDCFTTAPVYPPQLVQSSSSSTTTSAYLNETIAKASALPESFYPEFLQYSKESFEQPTNINKKRNRSNEQFSEEDQEERATRIQKTEQNQDTSVSEMRRQIHIQSEQKRRAQIKDGFEELRAELPACLNKKISKVTLLHKTVQHIKHLKSTQATILAELERLVQENEQLRSFQQGVLQKQALGNMYTIGNI